MLGVPRERVLVTGSSGHLGEALVRVLRGRGRDVVGLDLLPSPYTTVTGPVTEGCTFDYFLPYYPFGTE